MVSGKHGRSYQWMSDLLGILYEQLDHDTAIQLLRDRNLRERSVASAPELGEVRRQQPDVDHEEFDNLFVALLALRVKFDRDEAARKVELNIAMREGRR
ncbi:MAG TPA: hypothetical protein VMM78_04535 [Thermomicrobiales bacterium]|nr:hypothetical protein [Thermomicrobiales bacterium]